MKATRYNIKACCGKTNIIFKTDATITNNTLQSLVKLGFIESEHFTKAGILYVDNSDFIVTAPIGSNRLEVKCKKNDCNQKINEFEELFPLLE